MRVGLIRLLILIFLIVVPCSSSGETKPINENLVSRVAGEILKWKTHDQTRPWWYCGTKLEGPDAVKKANEWSKTLIKEINNIKVKHKYDLNAWGVLGTMSRESAFDECALGLGPRLWAYEHNLLKRRKRHISHTYEEIDKLVQNKTFMKKWPRLDLGPGQLMWRSVYKGNRKDLMSVKPGIGIVATEMFNRVDRHISRLNMMNRLKGLGINKHSKYKNKWWYSRPWAFWPGSINRKYAIKIQKRAYLLGATKQELIPLKKI